MPPSPEAPGHERLGIVGVVDYLSLINEVDSSRAGDAQDIVRKLEFDDDTVCEDLGRLYFEILSKEMRKREMEDTITARKTTGAWDAFFVLTHDRWVKLGSCLAKTFGLIAD